MEKVSARRRLDRRLSATVARHGVPAMADRGQLAVPPAGASEAGVRQAAAFSVTSGPATAPADRAATWTPACARPWRGRIPARSWRSPVYAATPGGLGHARLNPADGRGMVINGQRCRPAVEHRLLPGTDIWGYQGRRSVRQHSSASTRHLGDPDPPVREHGASPGTTATMTAARQVREIDDLRGPASAKLARLTDVYAAWAGRPERPCSGHAVNWTRRPAATHVLMAGSPGAVEPTAGPQGGVLRLHLPVDRHP